MNWAEAPFSEESAVGNTYKHLHEHFSCKHILDYEIMPMQ